MGFSSSGRLLKRRREMMYSMPMSLAFGLSLS